MTEEEFQAQNQEHDRMAQESIDKAAAEIGTSPYMKGTVPETHPPVEKAAPMPRSKIEAILQPYATELEVLRNYVPKELSKNPDAYLVLIIELMRKTNDNQPPRVGDLLSFMYQVYRTNLDPLARQIYAVYRKGTMAVQTSIDGFRLVASRTGLYGGSDDATFEENNNKPVKATVTVFLLNPHTFDRMAVTASARMSEYQGQGPMWGSKPFLMLAKCAESLALRKAFPQELSGIYTTEEMDAEKDPVSERERINKAVDNHKQKVDETFEPKVEE